MLAWLKGLSPTVKWVTAGVLIALLAVFFVWGKDGISNRIEKWREARYDARVEKVKAELDEEKKAHAKDIEEAKKWRTIAQVEKQTADALREQAKQGGAKVAEAAKQIDEAMNQYENDQKVIASGLSDFDLCVQYTCPTRATTGYPCKPNYCDRYKPAP